MEEWLSDPVQMRMAEDRRSRRSSSNESSRAASRNHSFMDGNEHHELPLFHEGNSFGSRLLDDARFPLSESMVDLMTAQYLMTLDGGELTIGSRPDHDIVNNDDDDVGLSFLEDCDSNGATTRQDRLFESRSLQRSPGQQTKRHDENSVDVTSASCHQPQTAALPRLSIPSVPTTMLARVSLVKQSKVVPMVSSPPDKLKTKSLRLFWPSRSHAVADEHNPILTSQETEYGIRSRSSDEITKKSSHSVIRKFTSALGRLFAKKGAQ